MNNPIATIGTFDGVHIGHQKIINRLVEIAREEDGEVVLLTFFPHPRMVLQPDHELKMINTQNEKIEFLGKAGVEHLIILPFTKAFSRLTSIEYVRDILVNQMNVHKLVIGYDHHFGRNREGNFEHLVELAELYDFGVEEIPAQMIDDVNVSSTKIRHALEAGDLETVRNYLGRPFRITGTVVEGKHLGRSIGYPTANVAIAEPYKLIPADGVYAVKVKIKGATFNGMMNIGMKPTVQKDQERSIEVHILDFDENIYNEIIGIDIMERIRDEQQFENIDALRNKLDEDQAKTRMILAKS